MLCRAKGWARVQTSQDCAILTLPYTCPVCGRSFRRLDARPGARAGSARVLVPNHNTPKD